MEQPQAFIQTTRKARKLHKCCECLSSIKQGDSYYYSSGIWDSRPYSFKQCITCKRISDVANKFAVNFDYEYEWYPSFGNLREWIFGFLDNEGKELKEHFCLPDTDFWNVV